MNLNSTTSSGIGRRKGQELEERAMARSEISTVDEQRKRFTREIRTKQSGGTSHKGNSYQTERGY